MSIPEEPFTLHGGCRCKAIRYKLSVPKLDERPYYPTYTFPHLKDPPAHGIRLPASIYDHCTDCRRSAGSAVVTWLAVSASWLSFRCGPATAPAAPASGRPDPDPDPPQAAAGDANSTAPGEQQGQDTNARRDVPGELVAAGAADAHPALAFHASSPGRARAFCPRCGTMLTLAGRPIPDWFTCMDIMDVALGTLDDADLSRRDAGGAAWLRPSRHMWWDSALGWVKEALDGGLPKHAAYSIDEEVS